MQRVGDGVDKLRSGSSPADEISWSVDRWGKISLGGAELLL